MTNDQLYGAGLAVGAIALGVLLVMMFRSLNAWWASLPPREPSPVTKPRFIERAWSMLSIGMVAFAVVAVATYLKVLWSAPGASIDMLLGHLAEWPSGIWKVAGGFLAASLLVGWAFPGVSFEELRTGKAATWRRSDRPFVPCDGPNVQAATMLVYGGLFIAVILVFGGL